MELAGVQPVEEVYGGTETGKAAVKPEGRTTKTTSKSNKIKNKRADRKNPRDVRAQLHNSIRSA